VSYHHGSLRKDLIQRAAEVIACDGIEKLSLRALARDLGVSHSAPARHFKDKASLIKALAQDSFGVLIAELDAATERAGSDPMARYNAIGKALVHFALDRPAYFRAMSHPDVRDGSDKELVDMYAAYMSRLLDAAKAAQAVGWLPGKTPEFAVLYSTAAANGISQLLTNTMDKSLLAGIDPRALGDEVIDLVVAPQSTPSVSNSGDAS
jgi:AcrR family transcriptional regulator